MFRVIHIRHFRDGELYTLKKKKKSTSQKEKPVVVFRSFEHLVSWEFQDKDDIERETSRGRGKGTFSSSFIFYD